MPEMCLRSTWVLPTKGACSQEQLPGRSRCRKHMLHRRGSSQATREVSQCLAVPSPVLHQRAMVRRCMCAC